MRTILLSIGLLYSVFSHSQKYCATQAYWASQQLANPALEQASTKIEAFISAQKSLRVFGSSANPVITVPVVVHILYKSPEENISDVQVASQIAALNRDFRRTNADTLNTPLRFKHLAADVQIEFALATADPMGRYTTGIVRKPTPVAFWTNDDKIKFSASGGDDAWDSRYYLNLWVGNLQAGIGYSSAPGSLPAADGVVITTAVFGTINKNAPYNMGRTAVHEVGHWLGLKHIWGDYYCGDDLVDDTPKQGNFTPGCPTTFRSSCNNGTNGDMYMNFMDYTNDACLNMFTLGQKERMRALFAEGGPRATLLKSRALQEPWLAEAPPVNEQPQAPVASIYPNPAKNTVTLNLSDAWIGKKIQVLNAYGVRVLELDVKSKLQTVNIAVLNSGTYFLHGSNGSEIFRQCLVKL